MANTCNAAALRCGIWCRFSKVTRFSRFVTSQIFRRRLRQCGDFAHVHLVLLCDRHLGMVLHRTLLRRHFPMGDVRSVVSYAFLGFKNDMILTRKHFSWNTETCISPLMNQTTVETIEHNLTLTNRTAETSVEQFWECVSRPFRSI